LSLEKFRAPAPMDRSACTIAVVGGARRDGDVRERTELPVIFYTIRHQTRKKRAASADRTERRERAHSPSSLSAQQAHCAPSNCVPSNRAPSNRAPSRTTH
jgi:hypothetical protein